MNEKAKIDLYWFIWNEWFKAQNRPIAEGDNRTVEYIALLQQLLDTLFNKNSELFQSDFFDK